MATTLSPAMQHKLAGHESSLLRIATAGSVDDGKSTLIGRLLFDSKQIFEDQLEHVEETSKRRGDDYTNLALLTDGLRAEREQGITIDVAYRYFATPQRKFILADTPGHVQYTRNMVTGASTADLALILIDARKGVIEQSKRHAFISSLLRIPHILVCINKMDLVDYDEAVFERIKAEFSELAEELHASSDVSFIPISALKGDNVVNPSTEMPWYEGEPLLHFIEQLEVASDHNLIDGRFPVQWVIRPMSEDHHDYRGYAGQVASGIFRPGDDVVVMPSGHKSRVKQIETFDGPQEEAFPPESVTVLLEDEIDVSRGDTICLAGTEPEPIRELEADICWMADEPLKAGGRYAIKCTTQSLRAIVDRIEHRIDIDSFSRDETATELELNDIGRVHLRLSAPLIADSYERNRTTGSFIILDEATNTTVGGGMIV